MKKLLNTLQKFKPASIKVARYRNFQSYSHSGNCQCLNWVFYRYYDYQLSKARCNFGGKVLDLFSMVTISLPAMSFVLLPMTSKANKLPLAMEPVARDNSTS